MAAVSTAMRTRAVCRARVAARSPVLRLPISCLCNQVLVMGVGVM